jgi:hypothetical protein
VKPKKQLEKYLNRKISDSTYFRIKRVMTENNLCITKVNLEVISRIKKECTKHRIPLEIGLSYYLKTANIQTNLTGAKLFEYVQHITQNKPHRITLTRWFIDGYKPEKVYTTAEISKILLNAFLYNLRTTHNATHKKSNRKCKVSIEKIRS